MNDFVNVLNCGAFKYFQAREEYAGYHARHLDSDLDGYEPIMRPLKKQCPTILKIHHESFQRLLEVRYFEN